MIHHYITKYIENSELYVESWIQVNIFSLVWCVFVTVVGFNLIGKVVRSGQISPALSVPMWLIYLAPCIGYALSTIRCIQTIVLRVKNYKEGVEMND